MRTSNKFFLGLLTVVAGVLLVRHANMGLQPARPADMPAGANFVESGYDITHNEPKGDWIACSTDSEENADFCRVTDDRGEVVYQGDFLPLRSEQPLPADQLQVARMSPDHLFVQGPAEAGPVPVIRLVNGKVLVPAADSEALADRWSNHPEELAEIQSE
jgi:hypothetical protein